jgi:hypothetical protein
VPQSGSRPADTHDVDDQACTSCGAQRKPGTDFCWQCYAPYRRTAAAQPVGAVTGSAASGGSTSAGTVAAGPLARPGGSAPSTTLTDALRGPSATGTTTVPSVEPSESSWMGTAIKVAVFLAFAVGGFLAWRLLFGGFPFPEEIAGQPRIENDTTEEATELISSFTRSFGAELEMAVYGDEATAPSYVLYVVTLQEGGGLDQAVAVPGHPLGELMSGRMTCAADPQGSSCTWLEGEDELIGVAGYGLSPEEVRPVAREVRAETS